MKQVELQKKCRTLNRINTIIVFLIIFISAITLWMTIHAGLESLYLFSSLSLGIGIVSLIVGRLLPSKAAKVYMSSKQKVGIAIASSILNKNVTISPSVLSGGYIVRTWNFLAFLIISVFMMIFTGAGALLCLSTGTSSVGISFSIAFFLWLILLPLCGFWTYYDSCIAEIEEHGELFESLGKKAIHQMILGSLIFLLIVGLPILLSFILEKTKPDNPKAFTPTEITQQIQEAKKKLETIEPEEFYASSEFETIGEALVDIQYNYDNKTIYYRIDYIQDDAVYIKTWNDESQDICVDTFKIVKHNRLKRTSSFISSSITKSDLEGKETGILK